MNTSDVPTPEPDFGGIEQAANAGTAATENMYNDLGLGGSSMKAAVGPGMNRIASANMEELALAAQPLQNQANIFNNQQQQSGLGSIATVAGFLGK